MGRADIAILSTISGGIRLCLHPGALCLGSAYDGLSLFSLRRAIRLLSRYVGTHRVVWQLKPSHWPHVMRASVVTGSYGLSSFLPVDNYHDQLSPACSIAGRLVLVAPVHPPSSRTANAAGRCRSFLNLQLSLSIE